MNFLQEGRGLQESGAYPVLDRSFKIRCHSEPARSPAPVTCSIMLPWRCHPAPTNKCPSAQANADLIWALAAKADHTAIMRGGLFRFHFAANQTRQRSLATLRGHELRGHAHLPHGTGFRNSFITCTVIRAAFYRKPSALFPASTYWIDITPHQPATEDGLNEIGPKPWHVAIHFEIQNLEPLPDWSKGFWLQGLPKYSLNMMQWRPDTGHS